MEETLGVKNLQPPSGEQSVRYSTDRRGLEGVLAVKATALHDGLKWDCLLAVDLCDLESVGYFPVLSYAASTVQNNLSGEGVPVSELEWSIRPLSDETRYDTAAGVI